MSACAASSPAAPSAVPGCGKVIRRFKLPINTACPLRCEYCFIDKDSGEVMAPEVAEAAVRHMLAAPGALKKLMFYGGEPLLEFDLVRRVALFARAEAARLGTELDLAVCTSGVRLTREQLEFLAEQRVFLSVSLDGAKEDHDRRRVLKGGQGSWDLVVRNLPALFSVMPRERVMAIQCVHPDNVSRMLENFQSIAALGFEIIEIEVIHGFSWEGQSELFRPNLQRVLDWLWSEALAGRRRFLACSLSPLMLGPMTAEEDLCPFHSSFECQPDGAYSFFPFSFVDWEGRRAGRIGHALEGLEPRYRDCRFDKDSAQCRGCTAAYYTDPRVNQGNACYAWRTDMARAFMDRVALAAREDPRMRTYLKEAMIRSRIS